MGFFFPVCFQKHYFIEPLQVSSCKLCGSFTYCISVPKSFTTLIGSTKLFSMIEVLISIAQTKV